MRLDATDVAEAGEAYRLHVKLVHDAERYDATQAVQLFFDAGAMAPNKWAEHIPCCIPPKPLMWLETRCPSISEDDPAWKVYREHLPTHWGWLMEAAADPAIFDQAIEQRGGTVASGTAHRVVCTQALQMRVRQPIVCMPTSQFLLQVGEDGRLLQPPAGSLPFPGRVTSERVMADLGRHQALSALMLIPALVAVSFMHCELVELKPVKHSYRTQKQRTKHRKPPALDYTEVGVGRIEELLRFEGQSGIVGLGAALETLADRFGRRRPSQLLIAGSMAEVQEVLDEQRDHATSPLVLGR
jgi:hypothetical protein